MSAHSYSRDMAKISVAKMLQTIGWNSINATPLEILTDILVQYLLQISKTANDYANEFGCTEPNLDHLGLAFRDCHVNLSELEEYVTFVDFAQPPIAVPKYPVYKEDNLNFLKPGSKECLTRPVHIHEHLPPITITEESSENEVNPIIAVNLEETQQEANTKDNNNENLVFKRPAEVSPGDSFKRIRSTSTSSESGADSAEQQGRPTREISSVMMTTSGFISPAREGRLPDSRTPIIQGPISEPPSPEPQTETSATIEAVDQNQGQVPPATVPTIIVDDVPEEVQVLAVVKQEIPIAYDANEATISEQIGDLAQLAQPGAAVMPAVVIGAIPTVLIPTPKKPKAPRKPDQQSKQRKEKHPFAISNIIGESGLSTFVSQQSDRQSMPSTPKPRKTANQASRDLARQLKKRHQQLLQQALLQSTELDQPINLSTSAPPQQQPLDVDVTKAKAKANRTLAAARRKTEKLNTTITPIPMQMKASTSVDKLLSEPDKKKVNILKKISNVRNEAKAAKSVPHVVEDAQMHQMLPSDVTIELVNVRNNQAIQQHGIPLGQPENLPSTLMPVKEKRKRKEKVAKPRKVAKQMAASSPGPWEDASVLDRPLSPEIAHTHNFPAALGKLPQALASAGLPFPFLPQFSGPGLIPNFQSTLFPNHLLPQAYALNNICNSIVQQHNPFVADNKINERAEQQRQQQQYQQQEQQQPSSSNTLPPPYQPARPGRPRKTQQHPLAALPVSDVAYPQPTQGLVSSTVVSPDRTPDYHQPIHQQISYPSTSVSSTVNRVESSHNSSPSEAVVGSTVILTPPSPARAAADTPDIDVSMPSTSAAVASSSRLSPVPEPDQLPQLNAGLSIVKMEKKNREHKKEKKDKLKKKNKKDKIKKDKVEKKKLREELKIKLKKEKREKKKEKDMMRNNLSDNLSVPKLTLKLGSPPVKSGQQQDQSGSDSAKLTVKPIILRKEESSSAADDGDKKRESSPELARISPLVTGQPKPKSVQPSVSSTSNTQHSEFSSSTKKFPVFKPIPRLTELAPDDPCCSTPLPRGNSSPIPTAKYILDKDSSAVVSTGTPAVAKTHHAGPGRPRKQPPTPTGKRDVVPQDVGRVKDSHGNEVWICPHCGKQDDGSPMIGCDDCDAWYHWVCVNMQVPPEENEDWYCKNCIKKRMQSSLLPDKKKKRKKKDRKEH